MSFSEKKTPTNSFKKLQNFEKKFLYFPSLYPDKLTLLLWEIIKTKKQNENCIFHLIKYSPDSSYNLSIVSYMYIKEYIKEWYNNLV